MARTLEHREQMARSPRWFEASALRVHGERQCRSESQVHRVHGIRGLPMRVPALLVILASAAHAQPVATSVEPRPTTRELNAPVAEEPDWSAAPSPRDASGVVRED